MKFKRQKCKNKTYHHRGTAGEEDDCYFNQNGTADCQWSRSCATVAFYAISSSNGGTGFPWCFGGSAWPESCSVWVLKAKSMFPADLFLPTVHLSCMFLLGVRKYLYTTSSIADATKENKNKDREDIREGGRRGKEEQREEQREDKPIQHPRTGFCHMLPCSVGCLTEFMIYLPWNFGRWCLFFFNYKMRDWTDLVACLLVTSHHKHSIRRTIAHLGRTALWIN